MINEIHFMPVSAAVLAQSVNAQCIDWMLDVLQQSWNELSPRDSVNKQQSIAPNADTICGLPLFQDQAELNG